MLFGRRRASFTSMLFAPLPEDAPPGGGGGPSPTDAPAPAQPPKVPPPAPAGAPAPAGPPIEELLRDPRVLAAMDARMAETDKRARLEAEKKIREEIAETARLEKLSVEERARQEATIAKSAATKAENLAAEHKAENAFLRSLLGAGLQPHDDDCMAMAWAAAKRMAGEGQPVTGETLTRLRSEKPHLFKSSSAAPAPEPVRNPAEVLAARSLTTEPAAPGAAAPGSSVPEDAFKMTEEQWAAFKKKHGQR